MNDAKFIENGRLAIVPFQLLSEYFQYTSGAALSVNQQFDEDGHQEGGPGEETG